MTDTHDVRNVIIIGGGPAGLTAALYNARADLAPLVFEGYELPGGQLMNTTDIENFPGFPEGLAGPALMDRMREQAIRFGAEVIRDVVEKVDFSQRPFRCWCGGEEYRAKTVIICTGAKPRLLGLESEQKYFGRNPLGRDEVVPGGVTTCATCDGANYRGHTIAVVGGGDSAMEEATFLTKFAEKVHVIHRRDELRASKVMQQRAMDDPKIEFVWSATVDEVLGDDRGVTGLRLRSTKDDSTSELAVTGLFIAIGHIPMTELFAGQLELDDEGYLVVDHHQRTSVPGVFAAGDVQDHVYRQAVTAAGTGCMAAIDAERWLAEQGDIDEVRTQTEYHAAPAVDSENGEVVQEVE